MLKKNHSIGSPLSHSFSSKLSALHIQIVRKTVVRCNGTFLSSYAHKLENISSVYTGYTSMHIYLDMELCNHGVIVTRSWGSHHLVTDIEECLTAGHRQERGIAI